MHKIVLLLSLISRVSSEICPAVPCPQNAVNCTLMIGHLGTVGNAVFQGNSHTLGTSRVHDLQVDAHVTLGDGEHFSPVSIHPHHESPKISFWTPGSTSHHRGMGVSSHQLNYHVANVTESHVFYAEGKNGDGREVIRFRGDGRVSIGGTQSTAKLQVHHESSYLLSDQFQHAFMIRNHHRSMYMGADASTRSGYIQAWKTSTEADAGTYSALLLNGQGGNVGIGRSDPEHALHVNGDIKASSFIGESSQAWKENIRPVEDALTLLLRMDPVAYTWKKGHGDNRHEHDQPQLQRGFLAEDFVNVFPAAVDNIKRPSGIDYSKVVPILVAGIQELVQRINHLEEKL